MIINKKRINKKFTLPRNSLLGFKILNSLQSVFSSYLFILCEILVTPFFGSNDNQILAGILFILLINVSILILIVNSFIQFKKSSRYFIFLYLPLFLYIPILLKKITLEFSHLRLFYS